MHTTVGMENVYPMKEWSATEKFNAATEEMNRNALLVSCSKNGFSFSGG